MDKTILKWFEILGLPEEWRPTVENAARSFDFFKLDGLEKPYNALAESENKLDGLLYALAKCQSFYDNGRALGIDENILIDTMQEVRRHAANYHRNSNGEKIGIYQIKWAGTVLSGRLYCLGRLEFEMKKTSKPWSGHGVETGDPVMGLHIPRTGGPMTDAEVSRSFKLAEDFFKEYYPNFDYKCYTCNSWLLDPTLKQLLPPTSNIVKFQNRFDITETAESTSGLSIVFGAGTSYENVLSKTPETSLQRAIQDHIKNGRKLYSGFGFAEKKQG